jgi:thiol-disulfide isomerase/thioredoxin
MSRRIALIAVIALVALSPTAAGPHAGQDDKETQFTAALQQGDTALSLRQFDDALKAFKRASGLRDKRSAEAHFGMARAYRELEAPKSAADSCTEALKYVGDDTALEALIRNLRGLSISALVEKNDDKRLNDAAADFRAIIDLTETLPIAHYNLGFTLLRQGRDEEGIAALKVFLAKAPNMRETGEARRLIEYPRRARVILAPEFSLDTLQGERIALEDLRGRVVVLDFWATWCPPCVAATPGLVRLHKKYASEPVTILGLSGDRNEEAWKSYVTKNRMDWPQALDAGRVAALFKVRSIPTYIVLDHEGTVRATKAGYNRSSTDGWLDGEIRKLLKAMRDGTNEAPLQGGR